MQTVIKSNLALKQETLQVISENRYLTLDEMEGNAQYVLDYFLAKGWTKESICGMIGNMQSESTINPGIWESLLEGNMQGGVGLVQWTPASKYTSWADQESFSWGDIDGQCKRIQYEVDEGLQWISTTEYPMTFEDFTKSTLSPYILAMIFIANYERPLEPNQPNRGLQAVYWYEKLTGGVLPEPTSKCKKLPIWMYGRLL